MHGIITYIDWIFFILTAFSVVYILFFAVASRLKKKQVQPITYPLHRFAVLFPAYKEDKVIEDSVRSVLDQDYPSDHYDVIVISDQMKEETNHRLQQLPLTLFLVNFPNSSKAKALNFAIQKLSGRNYDTVVILDGDNTVEKDFLCRLNQTRNTGQTAIQAHRKAKNLNTDTALLDAMSEEINNSIFRAGHVRLGLSAALIGSGMAFDYKWFYENIQKVYTAGEDKELEALLLQQKIFINYLDDVYVYDEKVQKEEAFKHQRRRWLAAQFHSLGQMWKDLPYAVIQRNWSYLDKIIQMSMMPRIITLAALFLFATGATVYHPTASVKWWIILILFIFALYIAIPSYLVNKRLYKAFCKIPRLGWIMIGNLFHLKGADKHFIHTPHGEEG